MKISNSISKCWGLSKLKLSSSYFNPKASVEAANAGNNNAKNDSPLLKSIAPSTQTFCFPSASQSACRAESPTIISILPSTTCMLAKITIAKINMRERDRVHIHDHFYQPGAKVFRGVLTAQSLSVNSHQCNAYYSINR